MIFTTWDASANSVADKIVLRTIELAREFGLDARGP
jgi:hypothetical protein